MIGEVKNRGGGFGTAVSVEILTSSFGEQAWIRSVLFDVMDYGTTLGVKSSLGPKWTLSEGTQM